MGTYKVHALDTEGRVHKEFVVADTLARATLEFQLRITLGELLYLVEKFTVTPVPQED